MIPPRVTSVPIIKVAIYPKSKSWMTITTAAVASTFVCMHIYNQNTSSETTTETKRSFIIPSSFMDNLSKKSYLNYWNTSPSSSIHRHGTDRRLSNSSAVTTNQRPKGLPTSLRILVMDIDNFGTEPISSSTEKVWIFDEPCRLDSQKVFLDGIARPKRVGLDTLVQQKTLVTSFYTCGGGVQILNASVKRLNPKDVKGRRRHRKKNQKHKNGDDAPPNDHPQPKEEEEIIDEEEAPWNQIAWYEEMRLRIHGRIPFASSPEPSSFFSQLFFGSHYRKSIENSGRYWFIRKFRSRPGIDGEEGNSNPASNKPHAVIANGHAMQSLPGSLLHLSKCCKEAGVPLYVIHDPRSSWGRNTHPDLLAALQDLKKTLKDSIVRNVLRIQLGESFERGRQMGRAEAEIQIRLRQMGDSTRRFFSERQRKARREQQQLQRTLSNVEAAESGQHDHPKENWEGYSAKQLIQELIKRNVITEKPSHDEDNIETSPEYWGTKAMKELYSLLHFHDETADVSSSIEEEMNDEVDAVKMYERNHELG